MESLMLALLLREKEKHLHSLSPEMTAESELLKKEIELLQERYTEILED